MLKLVLRSIVGGCREVGPLPKLMVTGAVMRHEQAEVARYEAPYWVIGDNHYVVLELDAQACVVFFDVAGLKKPTGPYGAVRFADGRVYDGGDPLATFDDIAGTWVEASTRATWHGFELAAPA